MIILRQRVNHREYKKVIFNFTSEISSIEIFYSLLHFKLSFQKFSKNSKISEELLYAISAHCRFAHDTTTRNLHFLHGGHSEYAKCHSAMSQCLESVLTRILYKRKTAFHAYSA